LCARAAQVFRQSSASGRLLQARWSAEDSKLGDVRLTQCTQSIARPHTRCADATHSAARRSRGRSPSSRKTVTQKASGPEPRSPFHPRPQGGTGAGPSMAQGVVSSKHPIHPFAILSRVRLPAPAEGRLRAGRRMHRRAGMRNAKISPVLVRGPIGPFSEGVSHVDGSRTGGVPRRDPKGGLQSLRRTTSGDRLAVRLEKCAELNSIWQNSSRRSTRCAAT
jgi:hypothetical protein